MPDNEVVFQEYLAARGGPFYELQRQLGLLREDAFRAAPRAVLFVFFAWVVPLLLSLMAGHAVGPLAEQPFLLDPGAAARFLVAVGLFMLMERQVEERLRVHLTQFVRAPLLSPDSFAEAAEAVATALRRRDSRLAEIMCLLTGAMMSAVSLYYAIHEHQPSWRLRFDEGLATPTMAGWWVLLVSAPIFWFLFLRWMWRHHVWAILLRRLAAMDLRLVASHPDGNGGLGFIGQYPNVYATFVFALSCVIGAAIAHELLHAQLSLKMYGALMGFWLAIVLGLFAWPLLAFVRPLSRLKQQTTLLASAQATRRARAVEREVLGQNVSDPEEGAQAKSADIADPAKVYDSAQKLSSLLIRREALLPVSAAALLPLVIAGSAWLPLKELTSVAKRLLLL
jgi:hypothetical protein